jgi:hypothetical protein
MSRAKSAIREPTREQLLERVRLGKLAAGAAEDEAARLGFPAFIVSPDPRKFDPSKEAHWSLLMALAWIMWRDFADVRNAWNEARSEGTMWSAVDEQHGNKRTSGFELRSLAPATELTIESAFGARETPILSLGEARGALLFALQSGDLIASGVVDDVRRPIEASEWIGMQIEYDRALGTVLSAPGRTVRFTHVAIASRDVQKLWVPKEYTGVSPYDEPENSRMLLGDLVIWIVSRGQDRTSEVLAARIEDAERDLVARLHRDELRASSDQGEIPPSAWAPLALGTNDPRPFLAWLPADAGGKESYYRTADMIWERPTFRKADIRALWPSLSATDNAPLRKSNSGRARGAPPKYLWPRLEEVALEILEEEGAPEENGPIGWQKLSHFCKEIRDRITRKGWTPPTNTVLREHAAKWLDDYRNRHLIGK